jgi:DNA-directed RNA polymerase specialized sigma24 family protein
MPGDHQNQDEASPDLSEQRRLLKKAAEAGAAGNEAGMLAALVASGLLAGLKRRLVARARERGNYLQPDDVDFALTQATTTLYENLRDGKYITHVGAFLLKVADCRVVDWFRDACELTDPASIAGHPVNDDKTILDKLIAEENEQEDVDSLAKRRHAFQLARKLLPQLGQTNVQDVMAYVLEATENGAECITDSDIADALGITPETAKKSRQRGFARLSRIVKENRYDELIVDYLREQENRT